MKTAIAMVLALAATSAHAYMGPGAGLGMLGSAIAVIGAVLIAVFGILVLPIRMIMKKRKQQKGA
jgi:Mn2+/Fe2+ NRAMP family transporter